MKREALALLWTSLGGLFAAALLCASLVGSAGCAGGAAGESDDDGGDTSALSGVVYVGEGTETPLPDVPVVCAGASAVSDAVGKYAFGSLPAGAATITVALAGYAPYSATVTIPVGSAATHDIHLTPNGSSTSIGSEGGTVTSPSGLVTLTLPAGAIVGELEVTITEPAQGPDPCGRVTIDLAPTGAALSLPGALTVRYPSDALPDGMTYEDAVIAWAFQAGDSAAPPSLASAPMPLSTTTSAGSASADIAVLGRYVLLWAPRCALDPGAETIVKTADSCMQFTAEWQNEEGAGAADIATSNFGRMMASGSVASGNEGQAAAQIMMGLWFRTVEGSSGVASTDAGDVTVRITHNASVTSDHYIVSVGVDTSAPYTGVLTNAAGGRIDEDSVLAFWQTFNATPTFLDPVNPSYPYQAQSTNVSIGGCHLEAGDINLVVVHLLVTAFGTEPVEELPGTGGEVSFFPGGLTIDEISVGCE